MGYVSSARELDQHSGRWISPDPAHAGWNAYAYPTDPNTMIDPTGLCWASFLQHVCNLGQRIRNQFEGEGFNTDEEVDNIPPVNDPRLQRRRQQEGSGAQTHYFWNASAQANYAAWYVQRYGHLPPRNQCPTSTCHTFDGTHAPLPQAQISPTNLLGTLALGIAGVAVTATEATTLTEGIIYRSGGSNPGNLKIRPGEPAVSFRDSLSNPIDSAERPVFRPGSDYIGVDVSRLPPGSAVLDNSPVGHVSVSASPDEIKSAIILRGSFPDE